MTVARTSEEHFHRVKALETPEFEARLESKAYIRIQGGSFWRGPSLTVEQARKLRDWLNDVLPTEET